jgi:hypothetical protein
MRTLLCFSAIFLLPLFALAQSDTVYWESIDNHFQQGTCIQVDADHPTVLAVMTNYSVCEWVSRCLQVRYWYGDPTCEGIDTCPLSPPWAPVNCSRWFDQTTGTMYCSFTSEVSQCIQAMMDICLADYPCAVIDPFEPLPISRCIEMNPRYGGILIGPFARLSDYPTVTFQPGCSGTCDSTCTYPYGVECYISRSSFADNYFQVHYRDIAEQPAYGCFCMTIEDILPITLDHFAAVPGAGYIALNWTTLSESNIDRFRIVRDGQVKTEIRGCNRATGDHYTWTDRNVTTDTHYRYQLIVANLDGSVDTVASADAAALPPVAVPDHMELYPAFPNPFNPTTEIAFELPFAESVSLRVFDVQGRQVATLVHGRVEAGHHRLHFNGSDLPSGVYIYQLQSAGTSLSGKIVLLK